MFEPWVTMSFSLTMGLCASFRGGEPERLAALILITGTLAAIVFAWAVGLPAYFVVYPGGMVVDAWMLVGLVWVGLRANRGWPLLVAALQIVIMLAHVSKIADAVASRKAYWAMTHLPFLLQMLVVTIGCWSHHRRTQRIGWYHPWRLA
ncbi:MAG: hypothetical protein KGL48_13230 [Sphingomonadales bacterium]|nr:hypothetical protein [Sphingomonadales bacterium]MDE2570707.1 hypothetical protein [Sphingomonadales bacterium]